MGPGGRRGGMISRSAHSEEKHPLADVINLDSDTALLWQYLCIRERQYTTVLQYLCLRQRHYSTVL